jgi:hypothetical protein
VNTVTGNKRRAIIERAKPGADCPQLLFARKPFIQSPLLFILTPTILPFHILSYSTEFITYIENDNPIRNPPASPQRGCMRPLAVRIVSGKISKPYITPHSRTIKQEKLTLPPRGICRRDSISQNHNYLP